MRIRSTTTTESSTSQPDEAQNSGGGHNSTNLNPANMLSQYKNASLEFGSGGKNATSGQATSSSNGDETQLDISQGAHRLAKELDEFVAKELKSSSPLTPPSDASISEDAIADLQLQTARKLRQVSSLFRSKMEPSALATSRLRGKPMRSLSPSFVV